MRWVDFKYVDFDDVPRFIFDEERDDHEEHYTVYWISSVAL